MPTAQQVQAAASQVAQDPDLGKRVKQRRLQLRPDDAPRKRDKVDDSGLEWLVNLVRWLGESARMLVWLAGIVVVALLLVGLRHWIRARAESKAPPRPNLPSHVQSLDIRPESLPDDIGAAASALWTGGDPRAALSLLYRGALSRLVHDHAVPIRAASTEGECVQLAERRLDTSRGAFFAKLVRAWQLAVYGSRLPTAEDALALCREFDAQLGVARATQAGA
ncbi:MAG: DUF4129 domain-containing protein [Ramlibacter sp.]|nr:DUF4129 domain-containing protein [Ramlibacter sp.]